MWTLWMSDVHNVLSSRALLSPCRLMPMASCMELAHLTLGRPPSMSPSIFPSIVVFSKEPCLLVMCLNQDSFNSVVLSPVMFQAVFPLGLTCLSFWAVQGIWRALLQHRISSESFFLCQLSSLSNIHKVTGNVRVCMMLASVSNGTSLLLMTFSDALTTAKSYLAFFWFLGRSLHLNWWLNHGKQNL